MTKIVFVRLLITKLITSVFHFASKPMTSLLILCWYESLITHHNVCITIL